MTHATFRLLRFLWIPAVLLTLWEYSSQRVDNLFFPPPSAIFVTALQVVSLEFINNHLLPTLGVFAGGFLIGSICGAIVGTLVGSSALAYEVLSPILVFLRSMPTAAKLPVLLGILGIGTQSIYAAVALSVFFNVSVVTMIGVARVHKDTLEASALLSLNKLREMFVVRLPAATGEVLTGLQTAMQVALLVTVLAETLASGRGMGAFLIESQYLFRITEMWLVIILLGAIGVLANQLFLFVERHLAPWYFQTRARGFE